jgi:hypothetical protein
MTPSFIHLTYNSLIKQFARAEMSYFVPHMSFADSFVGTVPHLFFSYVESPTINWYNFLQIVIILESIKQLVS